MISAAVMRAQLEAIAKKLSDGYTDSEIMKDLNIKRATFYNYKARIFNLYGDLAAKKTEKSLEFEAEVLKDRYIRLYRALELRISSHPKDEDIGEVAVATEIAAFICTNIFKLETEGLRARQGRPLQLTEQKAIRYIGALPAGLSTPDQIPIPIDDDEDSKDPVESTERDNDETGGTEGKVF